MGHDRRFDDPTMISSSMIIFPVGKMTFSIPRGAVGSLEGIGYLQLSVTSVGIKEICKISFKQVSLKTMAHNFLDTGLKF